MGCDIHLYTERKLLDDNRWICVDHFIYNPYYDGKNPDEKELSPVEIYDGRDYTMFTALAGVRNDNMTPIISPPRGLPTDVSDVVRSLYDWWSDDAHSASWLTAKELFKYDATHPYTKHSGLMSGDDAKNFDEFGTHPTSWWEWGNVKDQAYREWATTGSPIQHLVKAVKERMMEVFWIWDFLPTKEQEARLREQSENFRIVFWFDN